MKSRLFPAGCVALVVNSQLFLLLRLAIRKNPLERLTAASLRSGRIYSARNVAEDPHDGARGVLEKVRSADGMEVEVPGIIRTLSGNPSAIHARGPTLGEQMDTIFREAGLAGICRVPGVRYTALVLNLRGMTRAVACRSDEINLVRSEYRCCFTSQTLLEDRATAAIARQPFAVLLPLGPASGPAKQISQKAVKIKRIAAPVI